MKTRILLAMAAATLLWDNVMAQEQPSQSSSPQYAQTVVTIYTDPQACPMPEEEEQIKALLQTGQRLQKASDASIANGFAKVKLLEKPKDFNGVQMTRLELTVPADEKDKAAATRLVEAYVNRLRNALELQYANYRKLCQDKQAVYSEQVRQAELHLTDLMNEQNALPAGTADTESLRRRMQEQDRLLAENAMERAALQKRVDELSTYIDQAKSQPAPVNQDAASQELREQISRLEANLENEQQAEHSFDAPVLSARIAEAQILLAARKSQLQDHAAQEVFRLEQQRREAMMQLEELTATEESLAAVNVGSLARSSQYEILNVRIQAAKEALHNALVEAEKFDAQTKTLQRPVVNYTEVVFTSATSTIAQKNNL